MLDVNVLENKNVYQVQSRVRDIYYDQLVPLLEAEFDRIAPDDRMIIIDRLEIDLGKIAIDALDHKIRTTFKKQLSEIVHPIREQVLSGHVKGEVQLKTSELSITWKEERSEASALNSLKIFLKSGILPWNGWKENRILQQSHDIRSLIETCMESHFQELTSFLKERIAQRGVQQRVVQYFSSDEINKLLTSLYNIDLQGDKRKISNLTEELVRLLGRNKHLSEDQKKKIWWSAYVIMGSTSASSKHSWILIPVLSGLMQVYAGFEPLSVKKIMDRLLEKPGETLVLRDYLKMLGVPVDKIVQMWSEVTVDFSEINEDETSEIFEACDDWFETRKNILNTAWSVIDSVEVWGESWSKLTSLLRKQYSVITDEELKIIRMERDITRKDVEAVKLRKIEHLGNEENGRSELEKALEEGISIENGGLIILAGYLPFLFGHLGWLDNNGKLQEGTERKALSIMHYLVFGNEEVDESGLVLNKIILGIDINEPITNDYQLSEEEKSEAENLLENVLSKWEALGSGTSVRGLQVSFLQRSAIIYEREDHFLLRVERKTLDILLDRLPWSIGTIKLSWTQKLILTEW